MSRKNSREAKAARRAEREAQARQAPGEQAQGVPEGLEDYLTALRDSLGRDADRASELNRSATRLTELLADVSPGTSIRNAAAGLPDEQRREAAQLIQFIDARGGPPPQSNELLEEWRP